MLQAILSCGWTIAIALGLAVIVGPRAMYLEDHVYNALEAAFYAGFHRFVFAGVVGWIIVACTQKWAGKFVILCHYSMSIFVCQCQLLK